ncbi:hypothetical protein DS745_03895 [Anaerobacillus alkaliphilus]|uniref:DUF3139 domain-containing protein n=1 Tax=Anaerobacillus alkaliphilus TaxID=1548597 RepID=A0A4V1LH03_9BACI|nr:hypothetical protein [Anaerobacillus alkaliphilus]RXJ04535.1 hypothetical protein DS745_03895 [Anaerobacillus alkaliphilus]
MHPADLIEFIFVGSMILSLVVIAILLRGKWRKYILLFTLVLFVTYSTFFVVKPYWTDYQIARKVILLETYLDERYPLEEWVISTVPHRKRGYKHLNPYYIGVKFAREPEVVYHYWVEDETTIYQIAFSTDKTGEFMFDER